MATDAKAPKEAKAKELPQVVSLREREKSLQDQIKNKIPNLPEDRREDAMLRAQQHLDGVQAKIKSLTKAS